MKSSPVDFDLDRLKQIPDPYEAVSSSRPPPQLASSVASRGGSWRKPRIVLLAVLALEVALILRRGVAPRPELPVWFVIEAFVLPSAGVVLAWYAATLPGRLGLGLPVRSLIAALAITVALFALGSPFAPESARRAFTLRGSLVCGVAAALLAGLPFAAGYLVFRRTLTGCTWARMAIFGIACGSLAGVLVRLLCPNEAMSHVLVGHGAAILLFGLLGAKLGRGSMRV